MPYGHARRKRVNVLLTPCRKSRGRPEANPTCQDCPGRATLRHISQTYPRGYKLRIKIYDDIVRFLCGRLRQRVWQVTQEPVIPYRGTWRKPDLVVWREEDNTAQVFEVQVVADGFCLETAQKRKVEKYLDQQIIDGIKALTGCPDAATLNWRGCMAGSAGSALRGVGISKGDLQIMTVKALTWTHSIYQEYVKRGRLQWIGNIGPRHGGCCPISGEDGRDRW